MLVVDELNVRYGNVQALWDVSIRVDRGEIVSVLGANGAGKSTLVKSIIGLEKPESGSVEFEGRRVDGWDPHRVSALGIAFGPEGGGLFRDMSVRENLEMGSYQRSSWKERQSTMRHVFEVFPRLEERQSNLARTLSGGERQMLVMGRALMAKPTLCIFDEPTIGLAPLYVEELFRTIARVRDEGMTVLLIEQNVRQSLEVSDRAYVLESGRITVEGRSDQLLSEDMIAKAYLGL